MAVELMEKQNGQSCGKYDAEKWAFVFEMDARAIEIVIDLDNPPK